MKQENGTLPGMTQEEIERVIAPLSEAYTLPPQAYTDPAIYDLEVDRVMKKSWFPVGRVEQIANPGDYFCLTVLEQPLLIVHGIDGQIRVMSGVCLHRAAPIAEGEGNRKLFTCPYHAWSYATDGQLIRAPHMEGADGFSEKECSLPQLRTEVWEGFIMVNFDDQAEPFAPQVETFRDYFANFGMADMESVKTLEYDSSWNWKVLVENFMEAYHHIATHATTFEPAFPGAKSTIPDNDGPWSILHMPSASEDVPEGPTLDSLEDWQKRDLFAAAIFPMFLIGFAGASMVWYHVVPESCDRLKLTIHILKPKSFAALEGFEDLVALTGDFVAFIHNEDIEANDLVWKGLNAPLVKQGRLSPLEKSIWQLNRWWHSHMTA